jgi:hypothetical protein
MGERDAMTAYAANSACAPLIENRDRVGSARVLTIGGASIEHSYAIPGEFESDAKYSIAPQPRRAGGSSLNHTCRLLALGVDVEPVLPLARSDSQSGVILKTLEEAERIGDARYRRQNLFVRGGGLSTPYTTIIRQGGARATLNEFGPALMTQFREHVESHLDRMKSQRRRPDLVAIGHIHADRRTEGGGGPGFRGALTKKILTSRSLAGARHFVNFGSAPFALGADHWVDVLRRHVDVFQLDIGEARRFCRDADLGDTSLEAILAWFRDRCTVVISLERFGAVGQLEGRETPVAAWPYLLEHVVDSTGAGDAMGAGIMASMLANPFDLEEHDPDRRSTRFADALAFGRLCAAHACTTVGGANECPSLETLRSFEGRENRRVLEDGIVRGVTPHELFLIDRAFDR